MEKNLRIEIIILILFVVVCILTFFCYDVNDKIIRTDDQIKETDERIEDLEEMIAYGTVKGTGSMKPIINKNVSPDLQTLTLQIPERNLTLGMIYIYERGNKTIIHRLVGIYKIENKTVYVFMGDNNHYVDDPVNRSQVIQEVIGIRFR